MSGRSDTGVGVTAGRQVCTGRTKENASDNIGSLKVLDGAGFRIVGKEISYANARRTEIEETLLRLD